MLTKSIEMVDFMSDFRYFAVHDVEPVSVKGAPLWPSWSPT
jgi:hypothetical protein